MPGRRRATALSRPQPATNPLADLPAQWAQHPFVIGDYWRWHQVRYIAEPDALVVAMAARAGHHPGRARSITALGNPGSVAALLISHGAELLQGTLPQSVSAPPGSWQQLPEELQSHWDLPRSGRWDWMWTAAPPPLLAGEDRVQKLDVTEHGEAIQELQRVALPGTHFGPHRPDSHWFGIWHTSGSLATVLGAYDWINAAHLGGIGTHPDLRGLGLGGALTAAVTRAGVAKFGRASLGVYADNHRAKALYERLGYTIAHEVDSRHAAA